MAEIFKVAELEITTDKLIKSLQETKKGIQEIKEENERLQKAGKGTSEAFIRNEAELSRLRSTYTKQIKTLKAATSAETDYNNQLNKEIKTVDAAIANNKELRLIRNGINATTEEGAAQIAAINAKLDQNTDFVKENGSALEKLKLNVGNYKEDIKGALTELNPFNGGLLAFSARAQEAGGAGVLFSNSLKVMTTSMLGMVKATLAFIATPIGAILTVIVGAFALVKNALDRSEESTSKLRKAFSAFSGMVDVVLRALEPLGEFLIDTLVKGLELVERGVYAALNNMAEALDVLGFDESAESVRAFTKEIEEGAEQAQRLTDAELELDKALRKGRLTQLEYQKDAERLRQLRDDETKSVAERIAFNDQLGAVLEKQVQEELRLARVALEVANIRIQAEGETKEALDAQAAALTEIADIEERILTQQSEQLTNYNSLRREADANAKAARDAAKKVVQDEIKEQTLQLDLFVESQGVKAKTLKENLELEREVSAEKVRILEKELENKLKTQTQFDLEFLKIQNDLAQKQAELAVENAERELNDYIDANMSKLDADKFLTEAAVSEEQRRLDLIAEKRKEFAATQLAKGVIDRNAFNEAINLVDEENRIAKESVEAERKEAAKQAEILDFQNKLEVDRERLETDLALNLEYLEQERSNEIANAEKTGASIAAIDAKYAKFKADIEQQVQDNKLGLASDTLGNMIDIFGKESKAGKAIAITQTTIDTYASAVSAFNAMSGIPVVGPALGAIAAAAAVASGLASVRSITSTSTNIPKAEKGMLIGGRRHSQGGTLIEAEKGEAIMTRGAVAKHGALLSAINVDGGGIPFMERGGIVSDSQFRNTGIDYERLGFEMAAAVTMMPRPVVSVEEISSVSNRVDVAESASEL